MHRYIIYYVRGRNVECNRCPCLFFIASRQLYIPVEGYLQLISQDPLLRCASELTMQSLDAKSPSGVISPFFCSLGLWHVPYDTIITVIASLLINDRDE